MVASASLTSGNYRVRVEPGRRAAAAAAAAAGDWADETASRGCRLSADNVRLGNTTHGARPGPATVMTLACRDVVSSETVGILRRALTQRVGAAGEGRGQPGGTCSSWFITLQRDQRPSFIRLLVLFVVPQRSSVSMLPARPAALMHRPLPYKCASIHSLAAVAGVTL